MNGTVSTLDIAVVVLYLAGTLLIGPYFARRQRDVKTYFVGDRNVSWWLVLFSIVATETSTVTFLSVPGLAFHRAGGNLTFLQLAAGYVIGRVVIAAFLLPQYFRGELFSAYQVLRDRFSPTVQRTASGLFLLTRTVADGLRLYLTGLLLQQFTGWSPEVSIIVMGLATIVYTFLGGMEAVIWTDLIQFVIYILGAVLAGLFILSQLPGGIAEFMRIGQEAGKFVVIDPTWDVTRAYTLWAGLIGGAVFTMASHGADQLMVQRYLCSRSLGGARAALVLSGFVVLAQFLLFLLIGVGLYALYRHKLLPVGPDTRNDEVFGIYITTPGFLPTGMIGLVIAAVLAAAMSTLSSSLNSSANALVTDFYRPLRPDRGEGHYLNLSRLLTAGSGAAQMGVALAALGLQSDRSVIDWVLSVAGFTTGIVLGLFILGSLPRPVSSGAALSGLGAGFAAVFAVWLPSTWGQVVVAWPWYAPIGTATTVAVALLVHSLGIADGPSPDRGAQPGLIKP